MKEITKQDKIKIERHNIVKCLENLVHKRFNLNTLQQEIEKIFNIDDIKLIECTEHIDNCYMFAITKQNIGGVFDIMYLPMTNKGCNGETMYITEIGFIFDM